MFILGWTQNVLTRDGIHLGAVAQVWSAEAGEILLQRGQPRFELATTLLVPVGWKLRVDDLANDFSGTN